MNWSWVALHNISNEVNTRTDMLYVIYDYAKTT